MKYLSWPVEQTQYSSVYISLNPENKLKKQSLRTRGTGFGNKVHLQINLLGKCMQLACRKGRRKRIKNKDKKKWGEWCVKPTLKSGTYSTYLVQLYGLDPLESVFRIFSSEVPNAVVDTDVETALIKFVRLQRKRRVFMWSSNSSQEILS